MEYVGNVPNRGRFNIRMPRRANGATMVAWGGALRSAIDLGTGTTLGCPPPSTEPLAFMWVIHLPTESDRVPK